MPKGFELITDNSLIHLASLRRFYHHWSLLKNQMNRLPASSNFALEMLPDLLLNSVTIFYHPEEDSFRYRTVGENYRKLFEQNRNITGTKVSDLPNGNQIDTRCRRITTSGLAMLISHQRLVWAGKSHHFYSGLAVPLASHGLAIADHVMFLCHPHAENRNE